MSIMRTALQIFIFILAGGLSLTVNAKSDSPLYQVEVIAFQTDEKTAHNLNESFPAFPVMPDYQNSITLSEADDALPLYSQLSRSYLKLNREESLISKKSQYHILFHYGWIQHVDKEKKVSLNNSVVEGVEPYTIQGTIKIKRGYYYYVDLHFDFQNNTQPNQHFVMNTQRKLKSNELNYIDHPKFGMLLKITPLEQTGTASYL